MSAGTKYEGWTNYETWAVNLWLGNDQGVYEETLAAARDIWEHAQSSKYLTRQQEATLQMADWLKEWHEEFQPTIDPPSVFSDLLTAALGSVDWREIAGHWIDEAMGES